MKRANNRRPCLLTLVTRSGLDCIELSPFVRQILGAKRTPTSVRHVYDESRAPSRLLLWCLGRHCFNRRGAVAVAFRHPLRFPSAEVLVVHLPWFISPHVHAMPSLTPRSPAPLALRRPSHGQTAAFVRPPASSRWPTLISDPRNPSALHSKTVEAFVLVKPVGGRWMHRTGCFSRMGAVTLATRNMAGNSARLIVLVKRERGLLKCSRPINDTPLLIACSSLEATP